jgi:chemotaxis protein methyltransferase CheR
MDARSDVTLKPHEYRRMRDLVQTHFGIDLTAEKKMLIMNRLNGFVTSKGFPSYTAYLDHCEADRTGLELDNLASRLSTNHTYFFREEAHFDYLQAHVLPDIDGRLKRAGDNDLRIWCAAVSTGEEAYSILFTLLEYFGPRYARLDAGVLGTDISSKALKQATAGIYPAKQLQSVPPVLRQRYFRTLKDKRVEVIATVRAEALFRKFNLMTHPYPFKKPFHIIFCRNVMIYFNTETRRQLVDKLYDMTAPGGYLFIGHSEALNLEGRRYEYVCPAVYRKPQ